MEGNNFGSPLFLSPYIARGAVEEGREAAQVKPLKKNVKSFSGFLTVNETTNSNMFFWYFPSEVSVQRSVVDEERAAPFELGSGERREVRSVL